MAKHDQPFGPVRDIDPVRAARLDAAEAAFVRRERRALRRRAGISVLLAVVVVVAGTALFRWETDTRTRVVHRSSLIWVEGAPAHPDAR